MSDATVFVTIAFVIVWMKRKNRWYNFFQALEGKAVLGGSNAAASSLANSPNPASNAATAGVTLPQGVSVAGGGTEALHG